MSSLSSSINGNESSAQVNSTNSAVEQKPVIDSVVSEEVLSTLERDVLKRTRQANMVLMRQKRLPPQEQFVIVCFTVVLDTIIKLYINFTTDCVDKMQCILKQCLHRSSPRNLRYLQPNYSIEPN